METSGADSPNSRRRPHPQGVVRESKILVIPKIGDFRTTPGFRLRRKHKRVGWGGQSGSEAPAGSRTASGDSEGSKIPRAVRTGLARRLHRLEFAARSAAHGP